MIYRLATLWALMALFVFSNAYAQSAKDDIRKMLELRDKEIKTLVDGSTDEQREKLKNVINGVIDFAAMGQAALGEHWDGLTEVQRTEFVDVFSEIVRAQSLSDLEVYRSKVTYNEISVTGDSAFVKTTTEYKNVRTAVNYVMTLKDGEWLVEDIILDDVSTADGYARSFQTVVRKKGFDALMTSLNKKRDKMLAQG